VSIAAGDGLAYFSRPMRILLAIIGFLALAVAPLATPAVASGSCSPEMMSQHRHHHPSPAKGSPDHAPLCCAGLASPLPSLQLSAGEMPPVKIQPVPAPVSRLDGLTPGAVEPPPRTV